MGEMRNALPPRPQDSARRARGGRVGAAGGGSRRAARTAGAPAGGRSERRRVRARWRRFRARSGLAQFGYVLVTVSAVFAVAIGITGYAYYRHLFGNIASVSVGDLTDRGVEGVQNILVLGSQERQGQRGGTHYFGYEQNPWTTNSDNLLLIHLNAAHTRATVLSIPRDLFVYEPGCQARIPQIGDGIQGPYDYPPGAIIDGALNIGGPTCAVETVEDLTGIKLDHVVEFDFNSFRTMVDAMGGVEVCVPPGPGYHDKYSHVNLGPGLHLVTYDVALAYVRTRHDLGGADAGGDLPRIQLQQAFISSVVQKVQKEGLLSNASSLLTLAGIATKALTVDKGLDSVHALLTLAESLAHLKSKDINLITLPTTADTYPGLQDHLMAVQPQDDVLYQMVRTGQQW
ncbi:MAG TPA: LCP family protein, partial [Streptosporangiaceae bacterium]|nr:LCP family protein [Streptosporangiaceae bacterium]